MNKIPTPDEFENIFAGHGDVVTPYRACYERMKEFHKAYLDISMPSESPKPVDGPKEQSVEEARLKRAEDVCQAAEQLLEILVEREGIYWRSEHNEGLTITEAVCQKVADALSKWKKIK